jgi:LacI family transcriptional regulator/LacI family repressor for deo operon, udp, cdd, tsx, nupC, and nupG
MPELVNRQTLKRVRETAERLGYQPNRAARALATGRTENIGIIVPDLANPFFAEIIKGVQGRARESGSVTCVADSEEDPDTERALITEMSKRVDGIILCSSRLTTNELRGLGEVTQVVVLNRENVGLPSVTMDAAGGAQQAVEHLAALGHRRLVYLGGPSVSWSNRERRRTIRSCATRLGTEIAELGPFVPSFEAGVQGADLAVATGASAIIAFNDVMALGVLSRLVTRGIAVPEEVNIVGFDDIAMAVMTTPALTTVAVPKAEAGRAAVDLLIAALLGQPVANRKMAGQLIVRGSTGAYRGPAPAAAK